MSGSIPISRIPESRACIPLNNFTSVAADENIFRKIGDGALQADKILKVIAAGFLIIGLILEAQGGSAASLKTLKNIVHHYGLTRTSIAVLMALGTLAKAVESSQKLQKTMARNDLQNGDKALVLSRNVIGVAIPILDVIRSGACSLTFIAMSVSSVPLSSMAVTLIIGAFPGLTLAKQGLKFCEWGVDRLGAKEIESKKLERTNKVVVGIGGIVAIGELVLAITKICGVGLPTVTLISLTFVTASGDLYLGWKTMSDDIEKARRWKQIDRVADVLYAYEKENPGQLQGGPLAGWQSRVQSLRVAAQPIDVIVRI